MRKDLAKEINKSLKNELKAALASTASLGNIPVPSWVAERMHDITADWYPFIKNSSGSSKNSRDSSGNGNGYIVNPIEESPDDAAERLQDFYLELEQDMRAGGTPFILRRREKEGEGEAEDEKDREKREHDRMESETRVREVMEAVERTITSLFYDRYVFFDYHMLERLISFSVCSCNLPPTTRPTMKLLRVVWLLSICWILGLGILESRSEMPSMNQNLTQLSKPVEIVSQNRNFLCRTPTYLYHAVLSQLDSCRNPGDKSAILVAAHKVVVGASFEFPSAIHMINLFVSRRIIETASHSSRI